MANYRYKTAEIEAMKKDILTHCNSETIPDRNGNKSAWRLRLILEGMAMCCRCSKREEARRYRKLALFERLTANDMPNWPTQPATPAEATEPEIIIRRRAISQANNGRMVIFHHQTEWANFWYAYESDAINLCRICGHNPHTYGLSKLVTETNEYPIMIFSDEFGKPGLSKIPNDVLRNSCVITEKAPQSTEAPQIPTETAEAANVSAEGGKEPERAENSKNKAWYSHRWRVLHNCDLKKWDRFHKKHKDAILIFHYGATYTTFQKEALNVSALCGASYKTNRYGVNVCQFDDAALTRIIEQGAYVAIAELPKEPDCGDCDSPQSPKSAPQSPQTAQAGNYATPTPKAREITRKRLNSVIRNPRTTHTFFVTPRKCPSAHAPSIGSPR